MNAPIAASVGRGSAIDPAPALEALPALIDRAAAALAKARTSAEVLDARDLADLAYTAARATARLAKARQASDDVATAALRAQGDALLIEAQARIRLAEEYEAARDRGEMSGRGRQKKVPESGPFPTLSDVGLSKQEIERARKIRDAERARPGTLKTFVEERLREGLPPSKGALRDEVHRTLSFSSEKDLGAYIKESRAKKQAAKAEKRVERSHRLADRTRAAAAELGRTLYPVVYADFPWRTETWSDATGMDRVPDNHYPTLSDEEVLAFRLPAGPTAILFMWATVPKLEVAMAAMRGWGFAYRSLWAWTKPDIGLGYYGRENIEILLIGTRGGMMAPLMGEQPPMAQMAPRGRRHSEKPDLFASCIARLYPDLPKIELFARGPRRGWDVWGNEADGGNDDRRR